PRIFLVVCFCSLLVCYMGINDIKGRVCDFFIRWGFSLCVLQLGVLHNILEKLQNRRMAVWERRQSHLPSCIVGDYCTVKKGPRYGQLCDCPRGSKCNLFFLKCL
uniref:Cocaine- and amphetamine-regulated transcript protein n=1 Tax=Oncorhynchus kisutch TaxID=8019 RepID=A0A8C7IV40_ONCKI